MRPRRSAGGRPAALKRQRPRRRLSPGHLADPAAFMPIVLAVRTRAEGAQAPTARPQPAPEADNGLASPLSGREAEILALLAERFSNKEIAERLHITPETVKRHTANIYQKLEVHGRREAVERATSLGVRRP